MTATTQINEAIFIRVRIEQGDSLFYATSPDMEGLYVAMNDIPSLIDAVPEVIKALLEARDKGDYQVWRTRISDPESRAWVAVPTHLAAQALEQRAQA